ncbi:hypothetical protein, partial [Stutzerimonas nitrititolerans]|uniref:hypothetical protein n=1 Tax=Stutzerimonas nitrititolerans TaxID=2482751 RepID=UPI0028AAD8C4
KFIPGSVTIRTAEALDEPRLGVSAQALNAVTEPRLNELSDGSTARDRWALLLRRCVEIAYAPDPRPPVDQREACVFRLAGMVLKPTSYPAERRRLYAAGEAWLAQNPDQRVAFGVIVQRGWVVSAPWLRDSLQHELELARSNHTVITR